MVVVDPHVDDDRRSASFFSRSGVRMLAPRLTGQSRITLCWIWCHRLDDDAKRMGQAYACNPLPCALSRLVAVPDPACPTAVVST
jgi:hypothetical protein